VNRNSQAPYAAAAVVVVVVAFCNLALL
jgi:hypothetical protein